MNKNHLRNKGIPNFLNILFKKPEAVPICVFDINDPVIVELTRKPKSRNEVAGEYKVSVKVLNRWFLEKNLNIPQGLICPGDLRLIYATLAPPDINKDDH